MVVVSKSQRSIFTKLACLCLIITVIFLSTPSISKSETGSEYNKGVEYVKLRLYTQALDIFNSILSKYPNDINALFQLGNIYKLQDELELAIETFNKIILIVNSTNITDNHRIFGYTHLALSEIYCKQSKLDSAEQHAIEAVQICSTDADTHYRIGFIYTHQAKFNKALPAFKHALDINPEFAEVYEWLGLIALMQHKPNDAVSYYKTAINKKPYIQSAYYSLAKAYRLLGDMESAKEQLKLFHEMKTYYDNTYAIEGFLAEDPLNTTLRMKLAEIHLAHKHIPAAIVTYQALIQLNPKFIDGYDKLGRLYMKLNVPQKAIPLFQRVLLLNPNAVEAHVRLGWLYNSQKKFDQAELHLQKAIEKMPKLTLAYHGLAEIYASQGRIEKAIQTYNTIIEIAPDDTDAMSAIRNLQTQKNTKQ